MFVGNVGSWCSFSGFDAEPCAALVMKKGVRFSEFESGVEPKKSSFHSHETVRLGLGWSLSSLRFESASYLNLLLLLVFRCCWAGAHWVQCMRVIRKCSIYHQSCVSEQFWVCTKRRRRTPYNSCYRALYRTSKSSTFKDFGTKSPECSEQHQRLRKSFYCHNWRLDRILVVIFILLDNYLMGVIEVSSHHSSAIYLRVEWPQSGIREKVSSSLRSRP